MEAEGKIDSGIDVMIGNNKKQDLVEILEGLFSDTEGQQSQEFEANPLSPLESSVDDRISEKIVKKEITNINQTKEYENLSRSKPRSHTRVNIKVQDGCNQFCSYCIVPMVRGRARSRPVDEVIREVIKLSENGCKEVVLTGINLSSYGEEWEGVTLLNLIIEVHKIPGILRIRLGSLEPRIITEEFVKSLSSLEKCCPHFHLSLQSGCNKVLREMNRHYTTQEYFDKCQLIRSYFDHPSITTDIIVGFPGETEEDFLATKSFVEKIGFHETHIFKYSRREGTKAAKLPNQIPTTVKNQRSEALIKLGEFKKKEFERYYLGKKVEVLVEGETKIKNKQIQVGYTKEYVKIIVNSEKKLQNQMIFVDILEESQFIH
jgi:threonylcarbamoyladenosine tRNA methylthiotransferase MtaB